jgi:hypothetical protein
MLFAGLMAVPLLAHSKASVDEEVDNVLGIRKYKRFRKEA